uniref:Uncharacterized protein n=1 Tax=Heterorhabditis bacteriophora TaxID=37862 RepID=A0A1I7WEZ4_HETBA
MVCRRDMKRPIAGKELTSPYSILYLILLVLHANQEKQKSIKIDLDNIRQTASADGATEKTRFIKVDYTFRTESVVYDVLDHKVDSPSTILEGKFMFESLHHDMEGSMLTRFKLVECSSNNCGVVPPIFVTFTQGGNNIEGVFIDLNENPNFIPQWNILFAIINTIYTPAESGDGDDQVVPTVYGRCHVHFGRPEDKKFQRKINNCDLKAIQNYTRYHGLEIADYSQEVLYMSVLNMKSSFSILAF